MNSKACKLLSFIILFLLSSTKSSFADYCVLESNVTSIQENKPISTQETINLPKGGEIEVLDIKAGTNLIILGPYNGYIKDYQPRASIGIPSEGDNIIPDLPRGNNEKQNVDSRKKINCE